MRSENVWLLGSVCRLGVVMLVAASSPAASPGLRSRRRQAVAKPLKGGTLRVNLLDTDFEFSDPGLAYDTLAWSMLYATQLKLLNFPDKMAPAASQLYPEAATAFPTVSKDGKTYTFTSGRASSSATARPSPRRTSAGDRARPEPEDGLAGRRERPVPERDRRRQAFLDGKAQTISGVTAKGQTLTFKLDEAEPDVHRVQSRCSCSVRSCRTCRTRRRA